MPHQLTRRGLLILLSLTALTGPTWADVETSADLAATHRQAVVRFALEALGRERTQLRRERERLTGRLRILLLKDRRLVLGARGDARRQEARRRSDALLARLDAEVARVLRGLRRVAQESRELAAGRIPRRWRHNYLVGQALSLALARERQAAGRLAALSTLAQLAARQPAPAETGRARRELPVTLSAGDVARLGLKRRKPSRSELVVARVNARYELSRARALVRRLRRSMR